MSASLDLLASTAQPSAPSTIGPPPPLAEHPYAARSLREPAPPRPDLFTPERQARFLEALAETGAVRAACARVGVSAQAVYLLRRRSALFAGGWEAALVLARQQAEDVLAVRALDGVVEPVFFRGEQVGERRRYDARLLLAHLARLDARLAEAPQAAARAARFDEVLALVAGATPPDGLAADASPRRDAPVRDPLLPISREDLCEVAANASGRGGTAAARRRAGERWDRWQAEARARVDALRPMGGACGAPDGLAEGKPARSDPASLDCVNRVNRDEGPESGPPSPSPPARYRPVSQRTRATRPPQINALSGTAKNRPRATLPSEGTLAELP